MREVIDQISSKHPEKLPEPTNLKGQATGRTNLEGQATENVELEVSDMLFQKFDPEILRGIQA